MNKRAATIHWIHEQLKDTYGPRPWRTWGNPLSVLVGTILSQNTNSANSDAGFRKLWNRFRGWNKVADADVEDVARCIRISGLSNIKAPRIQSILREIRQRQGRMDLSFLAQMPPGDARRYLLEFKGVGPKTANCVLLFSLMVPVFPVDTHIHRIALRLGLLPQKTDAERAHDLLEPMIPPEHRYEMHLLLIEHGRKVCKAARPACRRCPLRPRCRFGRTCPTPALAGE